MLIRELYQHRESQGRTKTKQRPYANCLSSAVAAVLSNWHNVLRAINMASSELFLA